MHPLIVQAVVIAAGWDAWRWYVARVTAVPEEAATLAVLAVLLVFLSAPRILRREPDFSVPLLPVAALLAAYAASHAFAPPLIRCAIATTAALTPLALAAFRGRPPLAFWGLIALAMPVLPSLQFATGYPMRIASAALTAALLQGQGLYVAREGTFLIWRGEMVQFDAPCSGVNMLWAGLLLTLVACVLFRLSAPRTAVAATVCVAVTIVANALRAASLFYVEAGFLPWATPPWWHEGAGLVAFAMGAAAMLWAVMRLNAGGPVRWPG